jgi:S1-C subfamily serine protease
MRTIIDSLTRCVVRCAALGVALALTVAAPAAAQPTRRERQSLALVIAGDHTGTGFFLGGQCWATAAHVVDDVGAVRLVLHTGVTITARVVGRDGLHDVAVLAATATVPTLALAPRRPKSGDQVWAIGFPGVSRDYGRPVPMIGRIHPERAPRGMIFVSGMAFFGHSGSPVLDAAQRVVGVIVAVHRDDLDLSLAAPAAAVRALLRRCAG